MATVGDLVVRIAGESSSFQATMREGTALTRAFMTEQERNDELLRKVAKAYESGAISADTMSRAVKQVTDAENAAGKTALIAEEKMIQEFRAAAAEQRIRDAKREMQAEQDLARRVVEMNDRMTASYQMAMERRMGRVVGQQLEVQALNATTGASRNTTYAIQQLAFGAQDAATVFGTSGFAGAFRAASNNIIQFASLINPLYGTIAALAGTGLALFVDNMFKTEKQAGHTHGEISKLAQAFDDLGKKINDLPNTAESLRASDNRLNRLSKPEDMRDQITEFDAQVRDQKDAIAKRQALIAREKLRLEENDRDLHFEHKNRRGPMGGKTDRELELEKENKEIEAKQKEQRQLIVHHELEIGAIERRREKLKARLPGAEMGVEMERFEKEQERMKKEADAIQRNMQTPAEKMKDEIDRLEVLRQNGVLNVDSFDRAVMKARDEFQQAIERADPTFRQAQQLKEKIKTPAERFQEERDVAEKLNRLGRIDNEQYMKALDEIQEREDKLLPKDERDKKPGREQENKAVEKDTTEAFREIMAASKVSKNSTEDKMLGVQQQGVVLQQKVVAALERGNRIAEEQQFTIVDNIV